MKNLDFEWKILNPYHVIVRKKPENPTYEPVHCFKSCLIFHFYQHFKLITFEIS